MSKHDDEHVPIN
jgi:hypothetical protein